MEIAEGKVCIGFSKPVVTDYSVNSKGEIEPSGVPFVLARGVDVSIQPDSNSSTDFYADNQLAETSGDRFTGGTLNLTVDGLHPEADRKLYGLPEADDEGWTEYNDKQSIPYKIFGCIAKYMSNGIELYTPIVIYKVKFDQKALSASTQAENISFQTQSLTAKIMRADDTNHSWKSIGEDCDNESKAFSKLIKKMGGTVEGETHVISG